MSNFGGKAQSLIFLREHGFPVPEFHVLPVASFREFRAKGGLPESVRKDLRESLGKKWAEWDGEPVAVRSSATCEDGETASFAGLFETYLGLTTLEEVEDAVLKCWASARTERVRTYCERQGVSFDAIEMAVVVQRMIEPDRAGVIFTLDPIEGDETRMLIEACHGRGEELVSGKVDPSRYRLPWSGLASPEVIDEKKGAELSQAVLERLRTLAKKVQRAKGRPQDIEFAVKDGEIYLLQARDITRIQFSKSIGEWTTADFRDGGVSSAVVSPMMWELYEKAFVTSLPKFLVDLGLISSGEARSTSWYRVFFGRPYWNLRAVKRAQAKLPGFVERNFDKDLAIPPAYEGEGLVTGFTLKSTLRALRALARMHKLFHVQLKANERLLAEFPAIESEIKSAPAAFSPEELLAKVGSVLALQTRVEADYFRTIYNASNAKLEFLASLKRARRLRPDLEYLHLISDLGTLQVTRSAFALDEIARACREDLAASEAVARLADSAEPVSVEDLPPSLRAPFRDYVRDFGHHSERELDLRVPRWNEDLRFCLRTLSGLVARASGHREEVLGLRKSESRQEAALVFEETYRRGLLMRLLWPQARRRLERVRRFLWMREEMRDLSTKTYGLIRQVMLEVAERRALSLAMTPDELRTKIFYLSPSDVVGWLRGEIAHAEIARKIATRIEYAECFARFKNPNEIGSAFRARAASKAIAGAKSFSGIGASSGTVRAKARVVRRIEDVGSLQKDEILVAPFTDPGWTPVFGLAAAVITETGGLLSHAALISREYGIPSVLGVAAATDLIQDGQEIEVDGASGTVTIL